MDRQPRGARARDGRDVRRPLVSTPRLGLSRLLPARAAALLALLLAALALPGPAHAQTTVWSATLTVQDVASGQLGCRTTPSLFSAPCADNLTDDDFSYGGTSYRIVRLVSVGTSNLVLEFNTALSTAAKKLKFNAGNSTFNIANATEHASGTEFRWTNPGLSWTVGGSVSLSLTADTAPGKPTGLSASANGATQIDLSWTAPTNNGGQAISGYKIEVSSDSGQTFSDLEDDTESTSTTYSHTGLSAGTTRHYRVSAITSVGTGAASDTASATTSADATPPTISSVAVNGSDVTLSFSEAMDTASRPAASVFKLTAVREGVTRTISGKTTSKVSVIGGTSGIVSLAEAAVSGEVLTLSYTAPDTNPLQDTAGNDMVSFTGKHADNLLTTSTHPPSFPGPRRASPSPRATRTGRRWAR